MQMYNIVKQIGISEDLWQESIKKRDAIHDEFDGIDYYRVTKKLVPWEKDRSLLRKVSFLVSQASLEYCIWKMVSVMLILSPFMSKKKLMVTTSGLHVFRAVSQFFLVARISARFRQIGLWIF